LKNTSKISSTFTAILAVLILFAATLSGSIANNVDYSKTEKSDKKVGNNADSKDKSSDKYYFSKASVEAVFSPIFPSFNGDSVEFLPTEFNFTKKEIITKYGKIFDRIPHLEILFEHLNAPNAP
jgi:hypothetical protein